MAINVPLGAGNVATRVTTTATNSITVPLPANAQQGDVLIVTLASDAPTTFTTTTPGWTRLSAARSGTIREAAIFHAFTTGGLPDAPVFTQGGASSPRSTGAMFRVTGASQTLPASGASGWSTTADTANTTSFVIPATGATIPGATFVLGYNNANAQQGATTAATVNGAAADLQLTSYGTGTVGSSSTSQAVKISTTSSGPFTLAWGKTIANSQGVAVTIPAAGADPDPEPEVPTEPEHDDEPGVAIQIGTNNVTTASVNTPNANSVTIRVPLRAKKDDVLLCAVTHSSNSALAFPDGWQLLSKPRAGANRWLAVYGYRIVDTPPWDATFTTNSETDVRLSAVMCRLTGVGADFLAGASDWQVTDANTNRTGFDIPAGPRGSVSLVVAYNNSNSGNEPARASVAGATAVGGGGASTIGRATTVLDVFRAAGNGARTLTWSPAAANSAGFQISFQGPQPAVPATWQAKVFQGGQLRDATIAAVRLGNQFQSPSVVSWRPRDYTIDDLFSTPEFFIAHRGSGDSWPEHTMTSYTNATAYGIKALEVSVCATADGQLICHHDLTFQRSAGDPRRVADMTYAEIQAEIRIDSRQWTGLATPLVPPPLAKDVLDAYIDTHVIFIEDKGGTAATTLLNLMDTYPRGREKFVWKQWAGANQWQAAKQRGYKLWGYFMSDIFARIPELAPNFDYLGIPHTASDQVISEIVELGNQMNKPVICWEIHYRWMQERVRKLGVRGMMCSNVPYIYTAQGSAQATRDSFATGIRGHGDLPHLDTSWPAQPQIDPANGGVLRYVSNSSGAYVMGSMCPLRWESYAFEFEMRWPEALPGAQMHAGVWFGHDRDVTHRTGTASTDGGYHLIQRINGVFDLYRHDPGSTGGIPLATVNATPPVSGRWMRFRVEVTPEKITAKRLDASPQPVLESTDTLYRGRYFGLQKNFTVTTGQVESPLEYRNVIASELTA